MHNLGETGDKNLSIDELASANPPLDAMDLDEADNGALVLQGSPNFKEAKIRISRHHQKIKVGARQLDPR